MYLMNDAVEGVQDRNANKPSHQLKPTFNKKNKIQLNVTKSNEYVPLPFSNKQITMITEDAALSSSLKNLQI